MATVLLILSQRSNRDLLVQHLARDHSIRAVDPNERLPEGVDIVIMDVGALRCAGVDVQAYKQNQIPVFLPVVLLASHQFGAANAANNDWIDDVFQTPVAKRSLSRRLTNLLEIRRLTQLQQEKSDSLATMNLMLREQVQERTRELRDSFLESVYALTRAAEYRDEDTGAHIQRVGHYSKIMAERLGKDADFQDHIFHAAPMHDVGKIAIPDSILLKPGKLNDEEWEIMRSHASAGAQILEGGQSPYLAMGAEIAATHHERWDGSGYPSGLAGEKIPLSARIMSVADVYDALRSRRPYKEPFDHDRSIRIMVEGDGRTRPEHFDPDLLEILVKAGDEFNLIYESL